MKNALKRKKRLQGKASELTDADLVEVLRMRKAKKSGLKINMKSRPAIWPTLRSAVMLAPLRVACSNRAPSADERNRPRGRAVSTYGRRHALKSVRVFESVQPGAAQGYALAGAAGQRKSFTRERRSALSPKHAGQDAERAAR